MVRSLREGIASAALTEKSLQVGTVSHDLLSLARCLLIWYVYRRVCLQLVALLCRHSDDNKAAVSLENCKAFGDANFAVAVAESLVKHMMDFKVLEAACDAIRGLCVLPSNRVRLGDAGVCEIIARTLGMKKFVDSADTCSWICRALGHLANDNDANRVRLGAVGTCETAIVALHVHESNALVSIMPTHCAVV